ncbi:hypothetical protein BMW23_0381 [Bodo saltans virus]|jgi:hypothetical protein|uniref:Uncharacterized protein n=1 Tax=Bodo saltans virus TaxID=2024608 RepID=A0A2H4UUD3_9VIRU|nr:hypothetical protein QJ851_gp0372 [Bodo saltans virus]ATZ80435.1 hypothetical protein BMW23_0381 [Bodo saltans virus]
MASKSDKKGSKSLPKYLYHQSNKNLEGDFVVQREEYIIDGERGIKIKFFSINKSERKKVIIVKVKDSFVMKVSLNGKDTEKTLSQDDLLKEVKADKDLKFVLDFLKTQKGGKWMIQRSKNTKRNTKRNSKKSSKRSSKK